MEVGGQRHSPAALPLGMMPCKLCRRQSGPQGRSGRERKISSPPSICSADCPARRLCWMMAGTFRPPHRHLISTSKYCQSAPFHALSDPVLTSCSTIRFSMSGGSNTRPAILVNYIYIYIYIFIYMYITNKKRKSSPVTGLECPRGFQEVKVPRFHDNGT